VSVVDLHPEELFDKEARGGLSGAEQAHLLAHLERCSACRLEQRARRDFQAELEEGPRSRISGMVALALGAAAKLPATTDAAAPPRERPAGEGATAGGSAGPRVAPGLVLPGSALPPPAAPLPTLTPLAARRRVGRSRLAASLAFAAVLVAGVAAAAGFSGVMRGGDAPAAEPLPAASIVASGKQTTTPPRKVRRAAPVDEPAPGDAVDAPSEAQGEPPAAAGPAPTEQMPAAAPAAAGAHAAVGPAADAAPALPPAHAVASPVAAAPGGPEGAGALLAAAGEARGRGDEAEATRLYQQLLVRHPATREASVARAVLGRMLLARGDSASALDRFDEYLRSGERTLSEEAMVGRARTLERLGRRDEEAKAWSALLQAYPGSAHAARARARLGALQVR
jgi:TolA-binding protein